MKFARVSLSSNRANSVYEVVISIVGSYHFVNDKSLRLEYFISSIF